MKKIIILLFSSLFCLCSHSIFASTNMPNDQATLTLVNHFKTDLWITVVNQYDAPNFSNHFTLSQGQSITSPIIYTNGNNNDDPCNSGNGTSNSYVLIQAVPALPSLSNTAAFLGTGLTCQDRDLVQVSGLEDSHIAFSYSSVPERHNMVVFCDSDDYTNGSCS